LRAVIFGSRFGTFWWLRQLAAGAALGLLLVGNRRGWSPWRGEQQPRHLASPAEAARNGAPDGAPARRLAIGGGAPAAASSAAIPDWRREVLQVVRELPHLPARLAEGWRARSLAGRIDLLLAALLLLAFGLSGHAAAVPTDELAYALGVDLLHLLANAAWVGGIFYISGRLVPALR